MPARTKKTSLSSRHGSDLADPPIPSTGSSSSTLPSAWPPSSAGSFSAGAFSGPSRSNTPDSNASRHGAPPPSASSSSSSGGGWFSRKAWGFGGGSSSSSSSSSSTTGTSTPGVGGAGGIPSSSRERLSSMTRSSTAMSLAKTTVVGRSPGAASSSSGLAQGHTHTSKFESGSVQEHGSDDEQPLRRPAFTRHQSSSAANLVSPPLDSAESSSNSNSRGGFFRKRTTSAGATTILPPIKTQLAQELHQPLHQVASQQQPAAAYPEYHHTQHHHQHHQQPRPLHLLDGSALTMTDRLPFQPRLEAEAKVASAGTRHGGISQLPHSQQLQRSLSPTLSTARNEGISRGIAGPSVGTAFSWDPPLLAAAGSPRLQDYRRVQTGSNNDALLSENDFLRPAGDLNSYGSAISDEHLGSPFSAISDLPPMSPTGSPTTPTFAIPFGGGALGTGFSPEPRRATRYIVVDQHGNTSPNFSRPSPSSPNLAAWASGPPPSGSSSSSSTSSTPRVAGETPEAAFDQRVGTVPLRDESSRRGSGSEGGSSGAGGRHVRNFSAMALGKTTGKGKDREKQEFIVDTARPMATMTTTLRPQTHYISSGAQQHHRQTIVFSPLHDHHSYRPALAASPMMPTTLLTPLPHSSSSFSLAPPQATSASGSTPSSVSTIESGLLLRHTPAGSTGGAFRSASAKDANARWKPYKAVLKGGKLQFFKPPSDRKEIEAYFPKGIVLPTLQTPLSVQRLETEDSIQYVSTALAPSRRPARAFWGTSKHPGLDLFPSTPPPPPTTSESGAFDLNDHIDDELEADVVASTLKDCIRSGTPEALAHELVLTTQAGSAPRASVEDFINAVLFAALDFAPSPEQFLVDLRKAVERASSVTDEEERGKLIGEVRPRVENLVKAFCAGHVGSWWNGSPTAQDQIIRGLKEVVQSAFDGGEEADELNSIIAASPLAGDGVRSPASTDWLAWARSQPRLVHVNNANLLRDGFTREFLLATEPAALARAIHLFHLDHYSALFSRSASLRKEGDTATSSQTIPLHIFLDAAAAFPYTTTSSDGTTSPHPLAQFSFSPDRPHFLTQLVLRQVLASPRLNVGDGGRCTSSSAIVSQTIARWISVAEELRLGGDSCGFMAIVMALCSRPIARLTQSWRRIAKEEHDHIIKAWIPFLSRIQYQDEGDRRILPLRIVLSDTATTNTPLPLVPYLGTVVEDIRRSRSTLNPAFPAVSPDLPHGSVSMAPIWDAWDAVSAALNVAHPIEVDPRTKYAAELESGWELQALLQKLAAYPMPEDARTHAFFERSKQREPPLLGQLLPVQAQIQLKTQAERQATIFPLLFPQPLPVITLIDQHAAVQLAKEQLNPQPQTSMRKDGTFTNLAALAKGHGHHHAAPVAQSVPPRPSTSTSQAPLISIHGGDGRRLVTRPRSMSVSESRTASLDLARPVSVLATAGSSAAAASSRSQPVSGRSLFFGSLKEVGGLGDTEIRVCDDQLILKVVRRPAGFVETSRPSSAYLSSRPSSIVISRPSSVIGGLGLVAPLHRGGAAPAGAVPTPATSKRASLPLRNSLLLTGSSPSAPAARQSVAGSLASDESWGPQPLRVAVKAGTLHHILDVLIYSVDGLTMTTRDDSGVASGPGRKLRIDSLSDFREEFFATFRSFTSPAVVLDHLIYRYNSCLAAVEALGGPTPYPDFPSWPLQGFVSSPDSLSPDWTAIALLRLPVLRCLSDYIRFGGAQQDLLDDPVSCAALSSFLCRETSGGKLGSFPSKGNDALALEELRTAAIKLSDLFSVSLLRPVLPRTIHETAGAVDDDEVVLIAASEEPAPVVVRLEQCSPVELVNDLDSLASYYARKVTTDDMYQVCEVVELQSVEPRGWLPMNGGLSTSSSSKQQSTGGSSPGDDALTISDFHQYQTLPLQTQTGSQTLLKRFPSSVRNLHTAHTIVRSWLLAQICDPQIGAEVRQARLEVLLSALEVCRLRSADLEAVWTQPVTTPGSTDDESMTPSISTSVGAALRSVLVAPESRVFAYAWYAIGAKRKRSTAGTLAEVLALPEEGASSPCTADTAWLIERLIEVLCASADSVEYAPMSPLLNFDKRRSVFRIIRDAKGLVSPRFDPDRDERARLSRMKAEIAPLPSLQQLRALAKQEQNALRVSMPKDYRPFAVIVDAQKDKARRDQLFRDKSVQRITPLVASLAIRSSLPLSSLSSSSSASATKKKSTGGFRAYIPKALRSSVGGSSTSLSHNSSSGDHQAHPLASFVAPDPTRKLAQLDFVPAGKPAFVVSIADSTVVLPPDPPRSFVFQLSSDDGARYVLQAPDQPTLESWVASLARTTASISAKRRTWLQEAPLGKMGAEPAKVSSRKSNNSAPCFGIDLSELLCREKVRTGREGVPLAVERLLCEVEARGLEEEGIYRLSGTQSRVTALQQALDRDANAPLEDADIHVVACAFKLWLRSLPEPIIPFSAWDGFLAADRVPEYEDRLNALRTEVWRLPRGRFFVLKRVMEHLDRVSEYESENRMSPDNLATCFGPTFMFPPGRSDAGQYSNMGHIMRIFKALITQTAWVFDAIPDLAGAADDQPAATLMTAVAYPRGSAIVEEDE